MGHDIFMAELTRHITSQPSAVDLFDPLDVDAHLTAGFARHVHGLVSGRIAPSRVHDLMAAFTVFGKPQKVLPIMDLFIDRMNDTSKWVELLDLTNIASSTKRSYGHEILLGRPDSDPKEGIKDDPIAQLIIEKGYLNRHGFQTSQGILSSFLAQLSTDGGGAKDVRERFALGLVLDAEAQRPGTHISDSATQAFATCANQSLIVAMSIERGIDLRTWAPENTGKNQSLASHMSALQSSIEAKKAIDGIPMISRNSSPQ